MSQERERSLEEERTIHFRSESNTIGERGRTSTINQRTMSGYYRHQQHSSIHNNLRVDELLDDDDSFFIEENDEDVADDDSSGMNVYSDQQQSQHPLLYNDDNTLDVHNDVHIANDDGDSDSCSYSVSPGSSTTPRLQTQQQESTTAQHHFTTPCPKAKKEESGISNGGDEFYANEDDDDDESLLPPINLATLDSLEIGSTSDTDDEPWSSSEVTNVNRIRTTSSSSCGASGISRCLLSLNQSLHEAHSPEVHHSPVTDAETAADSIVNFLIFRPHYQQGQSDVSIKCRILVLSVPITRPIHELADVSISTQYIARLPTTIKAFRVPKNAIVALEFFRAEEDKHLSSSSSSPTMVCDGRVFIPSYLFHLVASKDLYIPNDECLNHVILDHSFDSCSIELPLDLCPSHLPPPATEQDAENHFMQIAEQLERLYDGNSPIARFSISAPPPVIAISPRSAVRLRHSPREQHSAKYELLCSERHLSTSVSPPSSYRQNSHQERPQSRSFTRPSVPRLRNLPPPSTSVALSPQSHQHVKRREDHLNDSLHARKGKPTVNLNDFELTTTIHGNDFDLTTPHAIVPDSWSRSNRRRGAQEHRQIESVHQQIPRTSHQPSPRGGRPIVKRAVIDSNGNHIGSLRSKSSTVSSSTSIQHQPSTNSSLISSVDYQSKRSIGGKSRRFRDEDYVNHHSVLWNSPREVDSFKEEEDDESCESYELFQSPLPSARARHSMPPVTYRFDELEISPEQQRIHQLQQRPSIETNKHRHCPPSTSTYDQLRTSPRPIQHPVVQNSPRYDRRIRTAAVLQSPRLDKNRIVQSAVLESSPPLQPSPRLQRSSRSRQQQQQQVADSTQFDRRIPINHHTATHKRSPRAATYLYEIDQKTPLRTPPTIIGKSQQQQPAPLEQLDNIQSRNSHQSSSSPSSSVLESLKNTTLCHDDDIHNHTGSTFASSTTNQLNNKGHHHSSMKVINSSSASSSASASSSNNGNVVLRGLCSRRRNNKPRLPERLFRRHLSAVLSRLLGESAATLRQTSSVALSTSSTIASSSIQHQESTEELIDDENDDDANQGCHHCAKRKKQQQGSKLTDDTSRIALIHNASSLRRHSSSKSPPSRLLKGLFCCTPCLVSPVNSVLCWMREIIQGFWCAFSNSFVAV